MVSLVFLDILQLPHTVISNSEKLTHPTAQRFWAEHFSVVGYSTNFTLINPTCPGFNRKHSAFLKKYLKDGIQASDKKEKEDTNVLFGITSFVTYNFFCNDTRFVLQSFRFNTLCIEHLTLNKQKQNIK